MRLSVKSIIFKSNTKIALRSYSLWFVLALITLCTPVFADQDSNTSAKDDYEKLLKKSNQKAYFEKNIGQWNSDVEGNAVISTTTARFYKDKISFVLQSDDKQDVFVYNMELKNINSDTKLSFKNRKKGTKNYTGCIDKVPLFEEVRYENIYPNIDLRFYVNQNNELEFDYVILPGGDPGQIRYALDGVEEVKVLNNGILSYCSSFGELTSSKPYTYQETQQQLVEIETEYNVKDNDVYFSVGNYDRSSPLIIDPTIFEWSTYMGGSGSANTNIDQFFHEGEFLYVCGTDEDINGNYDYPITPGAYPADATNKGITNLVVSKFDTAGTLIFSTYLAFDNLEGRKIHNYAFADNSVFFAFELASNTNFVPGISPSAFDTTQGGTESVIGRLDSDGTLKWTTYLGGSATEILAGFSAQDGIVAIAGLTNSSNFPLHQANVTIIAGVTDGFITKFDYDGNVLYSSYLGTANPRFSNQPYTVITKNGYTAINFFLSRGSTIPITQSPVPDLDINTVIFTSIIYDSNNNIQYSTQYNNSFMRVADVEFDGNQMCIYSIQRGDFGYVTPGAYLNNNSSNIDINNPKPHLYCIDVPNASLNFSTFTNDVSVSSIGKIKVENGFVYIGNIKEATNSSIGDELFLQKFDQTGNLVFENHFGFTASEFTDIEVYNGEVLMYVSAVPEKSIFTPTLDAAQLNALASDVEANYLLRTDVNGNYTYGTWISGLDESKVYNAFIYNGSIYVSGIAGRGFPTTVDAHQTLNGAFSNSNSSSEDIFILKISDSDCISEFDQENIIGPDLIEVCMNGTVPFIDGPILGFDQDSLPHYLIDGILTPGDNNFVIEYQWQIRFVGSTIWTDIAGAINPAYQPQPLTDDAEFRRIAYYQTNLCTLADTSNLSLVDVNQFFAPILPPDTVYYKCETSTIQLDVTATGGTPPYNYQWSPIAGLSNPNSPTPQTNTAESTIYNVEVTDQNGCLFIEQFTVLVYDADAGDEMISCIGSGVQIGTPHIAPGLNEFVYQWSPAAGLSNPNIAQPIANPSGPTLYTLNITGPDNCTVTDDVLIEPIATIADAGPDMTFCFGGSIQIGEPDDSEFSYAWTPGTYLDNTSISNPTVDPDELPKDNPLTYYLTKIHNLTGCADVDSVLVFVNNAAAGIDFCGPRLIGSPDHSSGLANFTWTVVSGDASSIVGQENLAQPFVAPNQTTLYNLSVEWNGVVCTDQVLVPECGCLIPIAEATSDFNCEVGDINFNTIVFGTNIDTTRYNYLWSPAAGIPDPTNPFPQNFTISLTTAANYTLTASLKSNSSISCATSVLLFPAPPPFPFAHAVDRIVCSGEGINIGGPTISGWTAEWTPDNGTLNQISSFDPVATPTELSTYFVVIEENSSGCQIRDTAVVEIFEIEADAGEDADLCENSIVQLGTPAIPGLVYSWEPSLGLENSNMAQPIDTIFASTTYILTVSDSLNTCTIRDTVVYTVVNNPTANAGQNILICQGGVGAQIGTPGISGSTYAWSPATGLSDPTAAQPFANPTSTTTYTLTVSNNAQGCFGTDAITVTVSSGEAVDAGPNQTVCVGETVDIGTPPSESGFTFLWTPSNGLNNPNIPEPTATVTNTITYTLTLTSPAGCIVQDTVRLTPSIPLIDAGEDVDTCPNEDIILGTPAIAGQTYVWTPSTGLNNPNIAQPTLTTSTNEVYTLTTTDANNCTLMDDVQITVDPLIVDAGPDQNICSSGVTIGTANMGSDFAYSWTPGTTLSNPNVAQPVANPSVETNYTVTITQISTGCSATDEVIVTPATIGDAGPDQIVCEGENVIIGTPEIAGNIYTWSPSTGLSNPNIAQPTATITGPISYTLTVQNGTCTSTDEIELNLQANPDVSINNFEALCLGACVQLSATNNPSYRYSWSPATGLNDPSIADPIACPTVTTLYTLLVTDLLTGCTTSEQVTINVTSNNTPEPNAGQDELICEGENAQIGDNNQDPQLTFTWSPTVYLTSPFEANSDVIFPAGTLGEFTYIVTATDNATGCQGQDTVVINISPEPMLPVVADQEGCINSTIELCDNCFPEINYTYQWTPANLVSNPNSLQATIMTDVPVTLNLLVTDNTTGCNANTSVNVDVNNLNAPVANAGPDFNLCADESISLGEISQGHTYIWHPESLRPLLSNPFISRPTFNPLDTGHYTFWVEVLNVDGCSDIDSVTVEVLDDKSFSAGTSFFTCENEVTLTAIANNSDGVWSLVRGDNTAIIDSPNDSITLVSNLQTGDYEFAWTLLSTEFCNTGEFDLVTVRVLGEPNVDAGPDEILCINESQVIGQNDQGFNYEWFPLEHRVFLSNAFISNPTFTAPMAGTYTLYLQAENVAGCLNLDSLIITVQNEAQFEVGSKISTCETEVTLDASISGGQGQWVIISGPVSPNILSPTDPNTFVTGLIPGDYFFAWNVITPNLCNTNEFELISVEIFNTPTVDLGEDLELCLGDSEQIGVMDMGLNYTWQPASLRSYLSDPFISNPTFTASDPGDFQIWLEIEDANGCTSADTIDLVVLENTILDAGTSLQTCETMLNLDASISIGTGEWVFISGPSVPQIVSPNDPNSQLINLIPGEYILSWEITSNGVCNPDESDSVSIEILDLPTVDVNIVCSNQGVQSFFSYTISVADNGLPGTYDINGFDSHAGLAYNIVHGPFGPFPVDNSDYTININTSLADCPSIEYILEPICEAVDYGDLPDTSSGTLPGNYETYSFNNGPSHVKIDGLRLDNLIDTEAEAVPSADALGDGVDEDAFLFMNFLETIKGATYTFPVDIHNTTGSTAYLEIWIDWNGDGDFEDADEFAFDESDDGVGNLTAGILSLDIPAHAIENQLIGFRARLSLEDNMTPYGHIASGEVEDYLFRVVVNEDICLPLTIQIQN